VVVLKQFKFMVANFSKKRVYVRFLAKKVEEMA
jgi:hypothetical protein